MKKAFVSLLCGLSLLSACSGSQPFFLSDEFYGQGELIYLADYSPIQEKINEKASFVVYVYNSGCIGCINFTPILTQYLEENDLRFYAIKIDDYKYHNSIVKFTPSVAIYKEGAFHTFLDPNNKKHTAAFKNIHDLDLWVRKYIIINTLHTF